MNIDRVLGDFLATVSFDGPGGDWKKLPDNDDEDELRTAGAKEGPLHRVADSHVAKLEVAVLHAFARARKAMRSTITSQHTDTSEALAVLREELEAILPRMLRQVYIDGGETAAEMLRKQLRNAGDYEGHQLRGAKAPDRPRIDFEFDVASQAAIDWADKHAGELIDGISETSREAINNATAELLETGDWSEALDEILAAVGDPDRARLIARNESMIAVHEGQREAWDQAVESGLLEGDEEREWIVVGDEKVCPICQSLEGKTAKIGQSYISDEGEAYEGPPAHVSCRCSEGLIA